MSDFPAAIKDEDASHPIAGSWRSVLCDIVRALSEDDYELARGIEGVESISLDLAAQNRDYVTDYGETLVELPDEAWVTSCAQWMGTHWDLLIDLYTEGEGASDLVLTGRMIDVNGKYRFTLELVYVP